MCIGLEATQPVGNRARSIQIPQVHGPPVCCGQRFRKMEKEGLQFVSCLPLQEELVACSPSSTQGQWGL